MQEPAELLVSGVQRPASVVSDPPHGGGVERIVLEPTNTLVQFSPDTEGYPWKRSRPPEVGQASLVWKGHERIRAKRPRVRALRRHHHPLRRRSIVVHIAAIRSAATPSSSFPEAVVSET
uniref:Uncharacterized protein n=1 Tax=Zea mays TaxID=4577 RepID=A0A804UKB9_MAIZE